MYAESNQSTNRGAIHLSHGSALLRRQSNTLRDDDGLDIVVVSQMAGRSGEAKIESLGQVNVGNAEAFFPLIMAANIKKNLENGIARD